MLNIKNKIEIESAPQKAPFVVIQFNQMGRVREAHVPRNFTVANYGETVDIRIIHADKDGVAFFYGHRRKFVAVSTFRNYYQRMMPR